MDATDDDGVLGSFDLIPYLASVEYNERDVVFALFDGEGRGKESVDRTASSRFWIASSNLRCSRLVKGQESESVSKWAPWSLLLMISSRLTRWGGWLVFGRMVQSRRPSWSWSDFEAAPHARLGCLYTFPLHTVSGQSISYKTPRILWRRLTMSSTAALRMSDCRFPSKSITGRFLTELAWP